MTERRFPPPWSVEELEACFIVKDNAGQKLEYVYFEEEPGRRSAAKLPTKHAVRRTAVNIVEAAELLSPSDLGCAIIQGAADCACKP